MAVNLTFSRPPSTSPADALELTFGATDGGGSETSTIAIDLSVPPAVMLVGGAGITFSIGMDLSAPPPVAVAVTYDAAVYRGPSLRVGGPWQAATPVHSRVDSGWEAPVHRTAAISAPIVDAVPVPDHALSSGWEESARSRRATAAAWEASAPSRPAPIAFVAEEAAPIRKQRTAVFEQARAMRPPSTTMRFEETNHLQHRAVTARHQEAAPLRRSITTSVHDALGLVRSWVVPWQEGVHPKPGKSVVVAPPVNPDLCYTPPAGDDVPLIFSTPWEGSTELTFVCTNHPTPPGATVVVPIQEVYMVSNDVSLVLASDGTVIPTRTFTLSLDYKSWAWSFTARVPRAALPIFDMDAGGEPKVLTATINGTEFGVIAESVSSDRLFNTADVTITGRGLIAGLADPYAPTLTFGNTEDRTAQQLVADVLSINGVSLGWTVDWGLTDWLVPSGAWAYQGTYMAAVQAIAAAAGGYVQPSANDQTVRVLPLFPAAPWAFDTLTADYSLPSAVTTREGIVWSDLPAYNRVFVSGTTTGGVLGDVTRAGTAGDFEKPMVTDQLITHSDAARQRGLAELAVGGRSAVVSLKLPVLPATGVIVPGKVVDYVDGDKTRRGIVRSVQLDVAFPTVYQTIGVETYV